VPDRPSPPIFTALSQLRIFVPGGFIQTLKFECLNKFVIVAEKHLDHICRVWSRHYNEERPHSSRDHLPPDFTAPPEEVSSLRLNDIVCTSKLGGVIHSYSRRAA